MSIEVRRNKKNKFRIKKTTGLKKSMKHEKKQPGVKRKPNIKNMQAM